MWSERKEEHDLDGSFFNASTSPTILNPNPKHISKNLNGIIIELSKKLPLFSIHKLHKN